MLYKLKDILTEFKELNINSKYPPVAVGRHGIRNRSDIYKKELSNDYSKNKVIRKSNLIIGLGSVQIDVGVLCDDYVYSVSPAYHTYLIDTSIVLPQFLKFVFKVNNLAWFDKYSVPAARQGRKIDLTSLFNEKINIPSLDIQGKLISKVEHILRLLKSNENELIRLDELIKSRFNEMFGDIYTNPKSFKYQNIGDIAFVTKLAGFEYTQYISYKEQGDKIMIRGLNCKNGKLLLDNVYYENNDSLKKLERSKLSKGDIVMTYVGTIGETALIDEDDKYHLAPNVAKISLNDKLNYNPGFYNCMFVLFKDYVIHFSSATSQPKISMELIRKIPVMVPPIELQNEFAEFVKLIDKLKFIAGFPS